MFEDRRVRAKYPFTPGSPVIFNLDLGGKVQDASINLVGQIVVSGVSVPGTAVGDGGPLNLVKLVTITANRAAGSKYPGGKILCCSPRSLVRYATIQRCGRFMGELNGSTIGNGANGTYPIYMPIPIFFSDPTARNPLASALNLDPGVYSSVQVQIDLAADLTGCFSGNNGTVNWSGLTVQWEDQRFDQPGDTVPLIQEDHIQLIPATFNAAQDFALPTEGSFLQWMILAEQGASQTLSDALLNRLTVTGASLNFDCYANDIRRRMYDDGWYNIAQTGTGQYFVDWTDGLFQNANNAVGLKAQWDVNNVSGANLDQFRVYTRRSMPLLASAGK